MASCVSLTIDINSLYKYLDTDKWVQTRDVKYLLRFRCVEGKFWTQTQDSKSTK